jgi:hypothetical protein
MEVSGMYTVWAYDRKEKSLVPTATRNRTVRPVCSDVPTALSNCPITFPIKVRDLNSHFKRRLHALLRACAIPITLPPKWKLLTYAMEQSPSEANRFTSSQEIPRILWNPKVHYRIHKCPPPVSILSQLNPVHTPTSYLPKCNLRK